MPPPDTPGPLDSFANRELLDARVVRSLDGRVELHGLDVVSDLSHHYSFAEVILTSLTGEPPTEHVGELFETCCHFAAPVSVAEAPAHVSRLCETIGTDPAGQVATVACALSEQVSHQMSRLEGFLQWLREPDGDPPEVAFDDDGSPAPLAEAFHERVRANGDRGPGTAREISILVPAFCLLTSMRPRRTASHDGCARDRKVTHRGLRRHDGGIRATRRLSRESPASTIRARRGAQ